MWSVCQPFRDCPEADAISSISRESGVGKTANAQLSCLCKSSRVLGRESICYQSGGRSRIILRVIVRNQQSTIGIAELQRRVDQYVVQLGLTERWPQSRAVPQALRARRAREYEIVDVHPARCHSFIGDHPESERYYLSDQVRSKINHCVNVTVGVTTPGHSSIKQAIRTID